MYEAIKDWIESNQTSKKVFLDMVSELNIKENEDISKAWKHWQNLFGNM